ncbi:hypothetical protein C7212DRAFT_348103 [Tuber magnatum]|uniref:SAP domain-containing protein n=1 Tax=Tuber magnatum TaxID=42249 RepID=A0A317SDK9_9PEZI|nr:hypothetical protein C7212DRAFT_348103 [Tuber magnatum]
MSKDPVLENLQKQCKAAGLPTKGSKAQLTKRLKDWRECKESSPENEDYPKCDAILATDAGTKMDAKVALGQALQEGELEVERVRRAIFVGNRRGLDLADLQQRVHVVEHKTASLKDEIAFLKDGLGQMNDRLSTLTLALREYRQVRERFISTFKRDKLKNDTKTDRKIIQGGNITAHGGDAAADALLYEG